MQDLLSPDDPAPFRVVNPRGSAAVLLVCDHAASTVPRRLGTLGLPAAELTRHIGWDIGAEAVTRGLAERLDAQAILASFSRLVVDANRGLDDPSAMARESDGTVIPGNAELDAGARRARVEEIYWPYHRAIAAALDGFDDGGSAPKPPAKGFAARGVTPALISVHSFTPRLGGVGRPWHVGVLWDRDARFAARLLDALSQHAGLVVGDNEPYSAKIPTDFTVPHHAETRGLPHVTLEIRQDEIDSDAGATRYAELIALALAPILADAAAFHGARG